LVPHTVPFAHLEGHSTRYQGVKNEELYQFSEPYRWKNLAKNATASFQGDDGRAGLASSAVTNRLLIPGTSSIEHLRENLKAATLQLPLEAIADLTSIGAAAK
jgi:aryl-alcohol dehydrogenase-like predicted oxidoreductase